jgi:hypothetical protein
MNKYQVEFDGTRAIEEAESKCERRVVNLLRGFFHLDWRACAWFLEHRFPERWRLNDKKIEPEELPAIRFEIVDGKGQVD